MIDDDFDKIVRNMFEQFFGKALRLNPEENGIHIEIDRSGMIFPEQTNQSEAYVDTMEYDDHLLVLVETSDHIEDPEAYISNNVLRLRINPESTRTIDVGLPAAIDLQESEMSYNNGVIEMKLVKTEGVQKEGTLTVTG